MPITNASTLLEQTATAVGNSNPSVSVNLDGISDWSTQAAFLDITKSMRPWFVQNDDGIIFYDDIKDSFSFDENGWLMAMPEGYDAVNTVWDWSNEGHTAGAADYRAGIYVMRYEGEGTIELYGNARVISQSDGEIVFENETGGAMGFRIRETDPNGTGDYLRDITVVKEEHLELFEAGAIFNPDWIELIDDMTVLRFMDWMQTNGSSQSEWSGRPTPEMFSYMVDGAPIEVIVALGNQVGADIWINVPHLATDEYIEGLATYVRDNLDPNLQVTVEYGNEIWNGAFPHAQEIEDLAFEAYGPDINAFGGRLSYYGQRASETMKIFTDVFGSDHADQLIRVAGTQYVNTWVTERILTAPDWQDADPDSYVAPSTYFDAIAVTTYFGGAIPVTAELRDAVIEAIDDPDVDAFDFVADMLRDPDVDSSIPQVTASLAEQRALADEYGLRMLAYEGGQHIHHLFATDGSGLVLDDFLTEFVRSQQMADLYQDLFDMWQEVGGEAFMQFVDVAGPSQWGSWGLRATLNDTNPRAELLDDLNASTPAWWQDRAGQHFQQGVTTEGSDADDTLIGTAQEDFLLGGAGDDILVGGEGEDGLHGGDGHDIALMNGTATDYTVTEEGNGYRLLGPDGSDLLVGIEVVEFADGTQIELDTGEEPTDPPEEPDNSEDPDEPEEPTDPVDPPAPSEPDYGDVLHTATANADTFIGSDLIDAVDYSDSDTGVIVDLLSGVSYGGASAGDTYSSIEIVIGTEDQGTGKGDWLRGDEGDNGLYGLSGNDVLQGGPGADTLDGGDGWDYLSYMASDTGVYLNLAADQNQQGHAEGDVIRNMEGIEGTDFADIFIAGGQDVYFSAEGGDDTIKAGGGSLTTHGGDGADRFILTDDGFMIIKDFNADEGDILDISGLFAPGTEPTMDALDDYLSLNVTDWGTYLEVDADGGGDSFTAVALINGPTGLDDVASLLQSGVIDM